MLTTIKYKKELDNYNNKDVVYTTAEYYAATLPYEFVNTKQILTDENKSIDIPKFINNLILLNPDSDLENIIRVTNFKLKKQYFQPLDYMVLVNMCEKIYNNKQNLKPQDMTIKDKWINPTVTNKKKFYEESLVNETLNKINNYFTDLINYETTKITKESISKSIGIGERTLYRHITEEQKQQIKQHNQKIKKEKEVKLNLDDCDFLFVKNIETETLIEQPVIEPEPAIEEEIKPIKSSCPIRKNVNKQVILREDLITVFENYVLTNNNNIYEFSCDTFSNLLKHFSIDELEYVKNNLNNCVELKKKNKLFETTKRELMYLRYTEDELTTDSSIEYISIAHHTMPKIEAEIEEIEYEDDADEDDEDVECRINEYC